MSVILDEKANELTDPACPFSEPAIKPPVRTFQTEIVRSLHPEVTLVPFGENETELTEQPRLMIDLATCVLLCTSHMHTVPSTELEATKLSRGEKATELTTPVCP